MSKQLAPHSPAAPAHVTALDALRILEATVSHNAQARPDRYNAEQLLLDALNQARAILAAEGGR
jgi:hypothetical protein